MVFDPVGATQTSKPIRFMPEPPAKAPRGGRVAVTAFGLSWAEAEPVIGAAAHYNARKRRASVFVLTDVTPSWLVTSDVPVELLPTRQSLRALDAEEWRFWVNQRWKILLSKWHIKNEIVLGQSFDDFVSKQIAIA